MTPKYDESTKTWFIKFRYKDWQGKVHDTTRRGFKLKRDAVAFAEEFKNRMENNSSMTISTLIDMYIEYCATKPNPLKPSTIDNKRFLSEKHFKTHLGNIPLSEVKSQHIIEWQKTMSTPDENGKRYADTYLRTLNNMLSAMFNYAIKMNLMDANPVTKTDKIGKARTKKFNFYTQEEFNLMLNGLLDNEANHKLQIKRRQDITNALYVAFNLLFYSGMREGELLALTVNDLDVNANIVNIDKTDYHGTTLSTPKTSKSIRKIQIPTKVTAMLADHINKQYGIRPTDRIFSMLDKSNMIRGLHSASRVAGLKDITVHDLRDSHASLLIELGYSPLMIAQRLGHEDVKTTLNIYSHLYPDKDSALAKHLDSII